MKFNELKNGSWFRWAGEEYRKVLSMAIRLRDDLLLDFSDMHSVEKIDRPRKRIDLIIQYLDWALIQAHIEATPQQEHVRIDLDLKRKMSITSHPDEPKPKPKARGGKGGAK